MANNKEQKSFRIFVLEYDSVLQRTAVPQTCITSVTLHFSSKTTATRKWEWLICLIIIIIPGSWESQTNFGYAYLTSLKLPTSQVLTNLHNCVSRF